MLINESNKYGENNNVEIGCSNKKYFEANFKLPSTLPYVIL